MTVDVKRKKGETFEAFLRRFNRRLMQSGTVLEFKKKAYKREKINKNRRQTNTLARKTYREKREYLKKLGRLPEEPVTTRRKF